MIKLARIPINTSMNILDLIQNKQEGKGTRYKFYMNYLVFFSSENLKKNFPPKNSSNLSHLDSYSNDSLSIYLDINGLIKSFNIDTSELIKEFEYQDSQVLKTEGCTVVQIFLQRIL